MGRTARTFESWLVREGECLIWTGRVHHRGYGTYRPPGVPSKDRVEKRAHRHALEMSLGRPLLPGMNANHTSNCTSKLCCNPDHLYEGTQKQNMEDWSRDRLVDRPVVVRVEPARCPCCLRTLPREH